MNKLFTILFVIIISSQPLISQWEPCGGPNGGYIKNIFQGSSDVYACTWGGGIFCKKNKSNVWEDASANIGNMFVSTAVMYNSGIMCGTEAGLFYRAEGDSLWKESGLKDISITSMALSGTIIIAGTNENGVFQSFDGKTWTDISANIPQNITITCLAFSGSSIYAGTNGKGVYVSTYNSLNWSKLGSGLFNEYVNALLPGSSLLYAATRGGVFFMPFSGNSWQPYGLSNINVSSLFKTELMLIAATPNSVKYRAMSGSGDWADFSSELTNQQVNCVFAGTQILLAGTKNGGVFLTPFPNSSSNWANNSDGISNNDISCMLGSGNKIFAGTYRDGLYYSSNGGQSWFHEINAFVKSDIFTLLQVSEKYFAVTSLGIYASKDDGEEWERITDNFIARRFFSASVQGAMLFTGSDTGIYKTNLNNRGWSLSGTKDITGVISMASDVSRIAAGTDRNGIYISTNGGTDWINKSGDALKDSRIASIFIKDERIYVAAGDKGIYYSANNGDKWVADNSGLKDMRVMNISFNNDFLYAATLGGVFRKTQASAEWKELSDGLKSKSVRCLSFKDELIYAGTYGTSIWKYKEK